MEHKDGRQFEWLGTVTIKFFVNAEGGKVQPLHRIRMRTEKGKTFSGVSAPAGTLRELQRFCEDVAKNPKQLNQLVNPTGEQISILIENGQVESCPCIKEGE